MRDRRYTILSTAHIPAEKINKIPNSVSLQCIPFIEISPRTGEQLKSHICKLSEKKTTVIFTSVHAVRSVSALLTQKPDWTIYCIRYETRLALEKEFGTNGVLKTASDAKSLSDLILADSVQEAVFFCGDQRMAVLPDNLKQNSIGLEEVIVYDTRLTPVQINFKPDALLFFSPSAVKSFFSANTLFPSVAVFAMGKTTAAELKKYTNCPVVISTEADKSFVINMALEHAGLHPIT